jgi:DNA polymerase-3 subunit epsilon
VFAVHLNEALSGFCEPERPISPESTAIHGITQEMVAGHTIGDGDVAKAVGDAKLVIAFNSVFDRRMTGKTWPLLDTLSWGCAYVDVDWRSLGLEPGKLQFLLMKLGFFFDGHRAFDDALATLFLLTQPNVLPSLLQTVRQPLYKVALRNTPFALKDDIKARGGYQWDDKHPSGKNWWKAVGEPDIDAETAWAVALGIRPEVKRLPASARHSHRLMEF